MNISLFSRDTFAQLCFGQADESVRKLEIDERGTVHIWKDGSNSLIDIHHFGKRFLVSVEPNPKPESSELRAIAHECAGFARDNYDEDDSDELNYTLTPEALWHGWHSKDGIEAPAMPAEFADLYYAECATQYGADFADDIRALSQECVA